MNKIIYLLSFVFVLTITANAQKKISGKVTDKSGQPIRGALILEVGTSSNKTISSADGTFELQTTKTNVIDVLIADAKCKRVNATGDGALVIGQTAFCVFGKAITSRMESHPTNNVISLSRPNATPP